MILPEVDKVSDLYYCKYMTHHSICYTNHELPFAIIAIANILNISALDLRLIAIYDDDSIPDYDVYLKGKLVGCIYYYLPF